jgi:putative ABC transport system substrate-binding protein
LFSYGADLAELFRRAASYVDNILKGQKPGEMPIQLPTKFELFVNVKVARTLGLAVPVPILVLADQLIE